MDDHHHIGDESPANYNLSAIAPVSIIHGLEGPVANRSTIPILFRRGICRRHIDFAGNTNIKTS